MDPPDASPTAGFEVHSMPNIPHNYSITFRAASLLGSQCCVLRYAAAPLTPAHNNNNKNQINPHPTAPTLRQTPGCGINKHNILL